MADSDAAQYNWLISNILRNIGLAHLKLADSKMGDLKVEEFKRAAAVFKDAYDFTLGGTTSTGLHSEDYVATAYGLRGALAALLNYQALCLSRAALAQNQAPKEGLKLFEETAKLYETIFAEKGFTAAMRLKCHDWISHLCHRGIILCETVEKKITEDKEEIQNILGEAEQLFLTVLEGRIANKADNQRLGDAYEWLGRTYIGLAQYKNAKKYLDLSLEHYEKAFPIKDGKIAPQITRVKERLRNLPLAPEPALSFTAANMAPPPAVNANASEQVKMGISNSK